MGWFNNSWFTSFGLKKKIEPVATPVVSELRVLDYPKDKYRVYWETIVTQPSSENYHAEVRFMERSGNVVELHTVDAPTLETVNKLVKKLITEKMENFKV